MASTRTERKGILMAGGAGTRLHPLTFVLSKQILPIYDKPMIYYPLSVLMLAGVRDILIITTPRDAPLIQRLLGDGAQWGLSLSYLDQPAPDGIAQAFILGRDFLDGNPSLLILGDNIFYGDGFGSLLRRINRRRDGASVFAYWVNDPERYGVVEFNSGGRVIGLQEKPRAPRSNYAVPGLYFYDGRVSDIAADLAPSARGELEITDINLRYLEMGTLTAERLGRGYAWLDAGTHDALLEAAQFIQVVEQRQGLKIACPEEIAFRARYIDAEQLARLAKPLAKTEYGKYLLRVLAETPG